MFPAAVQFDQLALISQAGFPGLQQALICQARQPGQHILQQAAQQGGRSHRPAGLGFDTSGREAELRGRRHSRGCKVDANAQQHSLQAFPGPVGLSQHPADLPTIEEHIIGPLDLRLQPESLQSLADSQGAQTGQPAEGGRLKAGGQRQQQAGSQSAARRGMPAAAVTAAALGLLPSGGQGRAGLAGSSPLGDDVIGGTDAIKEGGLTERQAGHGLGELLGIHAVILAAFGILQNLLESAAAFPYNCARKVLMRKILQLLFLFLCAGGLAACSSAPPAVPLVVLSENGATRLIEHTFGQTEIPAQPQRVFALGEEGLLANLLDAGIKPIGSNVNLTDALPLFSAEELEGVSLYQTSGQFSLEEIAKAEPDLIIGNVFFIHTAGYEKLSQIAPTIAIGGNDPLESYTQTLAAFGQSEKASADLAAFEAAAAAVARAIDAPARQVSVAAVYAGPSPAIFVDGPQTPPWLLKKLGVQFIPTEAEREGISFRDGRAFVSLERVDLLHGEELILLQSELVDGEPQALAKIQQDSLWGQLPAVQNGQVSVLDRLGYPGLRGLYALLADIQAIFE